MSTAAWIAATPSRTWVISRSSGPRTAATMQNSVAPVAAVSSAALTSCGMSSHTERTGEVNRPDWLQKWQSSGQPPVLRLMMPSTSTSGPQCFIRTSCARSRSSWTRSSGRFSTSTSSSYDSPSPRSRTWVRARSRMSVTASKIARVRGRPSPRSGRGRDRIRRPVGSVDSPAMSFPTDAELLAYDREHVWHPYTSMTDPVPTRLVTGADGVRLRLADGRELVDGMSSWWAAIHGYRHPALDAALHAQVDDFAHVMFGGLTHAPAVRARPAAGRDHAGRARARLPRRLRLGQRRGRAQDGAPAPARARAVRSAPGC